jgi:8-amino-7-oxononanoate synthase
MLDFTSALYLGLHHPTGALRPWSQLTTGVPAALAAPPEAEQVAQQLAALQGCERGVLGPSTLHLFWDLFGMLSRHRVAVYVDAGTYPIARWGAERAAGRGVPVREFAHHDAEALRTELRHHGQSQLRPVVLTDGFCPSCGRPAPLRFYLDSVRASDGWLVVDDTQALGIFGHWPGPDAPYGRGGGGMLPHAQICGPDVIAVSSLAKAFGAPLAVMSGSKEAIADFEQNSETRMHCSPPSLPSIRACEHALAVNRNRGDQLRRRLTRLVTGFRQRAGRAGFRFSGRLFPVQSLMPAPGANPVHVYQRLLKQGIRSVLHSSPDGRGERVSLVITARHVPEQIECAAKALTELSNRSGTKSESRFLGRGYTSWDTD